MDIIHRNGPSGRIIHDLDCTWCKHRKRIPKAKDGKYELEMCNLSGNIIPAPKSGGRYCEKYQKEGCHCPRCNTIVTNGTNY